MGESTSIGWCDATFNPWWGCERVSPGCAHCYADTLATRYGMAELWDGAAHGFRFFGDKHWQEPLKWAQTLPAKLGRRPRVFCASMADVFEDAAVLEPHRARLFDLVDETPELDWLVLTKRPEFAHDWIYANAGSKPRPNVWLGVSIENARFTWRADVLREIPAAVRFISAEPLLGSLFERKLRDLPDADDLGSRIPVKRVVKAPLDLTGIDWIIVGGESGPKARPFHLEHAREIVRACAWRQEDSARPPAVFVKQLGAKPIALLPKAMGRVISYFPSQLKLSDRKGEDWSEWPADLRVREFPSSPADRVAATAALNLSEPVPHRSGGAA